MACLKNLLLDIESGYNANLPSATSLDHMGKTLFVGVVLRFQYLPSFSVPLLRLVLGDRLRSLCVEGIDRFEDETREQSVVLLEDLFGHIQVSLKKGLVRLVHVLVGLADDALIGSLLFNREAVPLWTPERVDDELDVPIVVGGNGTAMYDMERREVHLRAYNFLDCVERCHFDVAKDGDGEFWGMRKRERQRTAEVPYLKGGGWEAEWGASWGQRA